MEPGSARIPVERDRVELRDLGEVEYFMTRRYVNHRPRMSGDRHDLVFRSQAAGAAGLTVDHMTYGASVSVTSDPVDTILLTDVIDGRFDLTARGETGRAGPGASLLHPLGVPLHASMEHMKFVATQLPAAVVARVAGRFGVEPGDLRFDGMEPVSPAMNRHWLATAALLARSLAGPDPAAAHPLILSGVLEVAAAAVLATFPNTTMRVDYSGPGSAAPAAVRRAVAFIDANADRPITIEDIAAAAGVGVRGLQAAFARHRDTSPTGYLRRVRMERAHRDLQSGDRARGDTVAGVARRWGFTAPGRFAVEYRRTFGRSPGETLGI